ncbi:MAG: 6-phosphogluconolactonase, partial [Oceanidesulfovibrio sp.]
MERFLRYFKTSESYADAAAREIASLLVEAVEARGRATIAMAGGSTPKPVYRRLGSLSGIPWSQVDVFLGDERMAPPDSEQSNLGMVRENLLDTLQGEKPNVHAVDTRKNPVEAAADYQARLAGVLEAAVPGNDRLDLVLLGMGQDGHTASLFPESAALQESSARVAAVPAGDVSAGMKPRVDRVTLTLPAINEARCVMFFIMDEARLRL